jgi:uncharacterized membrane protein YgaE (UPF0421/DUF939 family)
VNKNPFSIDRRELIQAVRTTVAAIISFVVARFFKLPESYWAPISTVVVLQSPFGMEWAASLQRLAGTALGATVGALMVRYVGGSLWAFGLGILIAGAICALLHLGRTALQNAGVTVVIVMLIPHTAAAWIVGLHRFTEFGIGIAVGLIITAIWREAPAPTSKH